MSAAEAALYGAIIAGTFTLLGVMVERLIRVLGRLRFGASVSSLLLTGVNTGETGGRGIIPLAEADDGGGGCVLRLRR